MKNIDEKIILLSKKAEENIKDMFNSIEEIALCNQNKVLSAFQKYRISAMHLGGTNGYGYDDIGRDTLEKLYAEIFGGEDALVRHTIVSGTHALATALFGVLRPSDIMLSITGKPYDTLDEVIGISGSDGCGSLRDFGVKYEQIELFDGKVDIEKVISRIKQEKIKLIFMQRSKGYLDRPTLTIEEIENVCRQIKNVDKDVIIAIDNCYGEFAETREPCEVGADLCIGSLIKNPGGGIAQTGGYICGRQDLIEFCSYRLTSHGIGKEVGASLNQNPYMYQGLFMAPHTVSQAMKTAIFAASMYELLGFKVNPASNEFRSDIIETIYFNDKDKLVSFCKGIQKGSPIDSHVTPEPWAMPGYSDEVIMAAGAFVQGSSIELSADAPIKPPYIAYMQGGLTYESGKLGIMLSAQSLLDDGFIEL